MSWACLGPVSLLTLPLPSLSSLCTADAFLFHQAQKFSLKMGRQKSCPVQLLNREKTLKCFQGKMKLAKCLRDEGFREKLLCRPPAIVAGTFAEAAPLGPVVLDFALISREHSSRSHTQMFNGSPVAT